MVKNVELVKALGQSARSAKVPVDRFPLSGRGPVEECKTHTLSFNSFPFPVEVPSFPVDFRSRQR